MLWIAVRIKDWAVGWGQSSVGWRRCKNEYKICNNTDSTAVTDCKAGMPTTACVVSR